VKDYVVAINSGFVGESGTLNRGDIYSADDPIVRAHPDLFTDDPHAHGLIRGTGPGRVEDTSAAPGELRHVRPAKTRPVADSPQA
jgi:hypothetical protein